MYFGIVKTVNRVLVTASYSGFHKLGKSGFKTGNGCFAPVTNRHLTSSARAQDIRVRKVSGLQRSTWCVCSAECWHP